MACKMKSVKKKILIVDDDPDILAFIQAMLEEAGYVVVTTDKSENLETISVDDLPDLFLLDMLLSGRDGRRIARQLKSQERTKHIPVIIFSAHPVAKEEAKAAGADDFIAKPFEMDELLAKIGKYLK